MRAVYLRGHHKERVRKKNIKRVERLVEYAMKTWGCFPYPPEWRRMDQLRKEQGLI
jgi:hypothetical protein